MTSTSSPETWTLPTPMGHHITARCFYSDAPPKGVCVLAPATGVAQVLYDDLAKWLTQQGYHAVTFDYDGVGLSQEFGVKHSKSDVLSWGTNDSTTLLAAVKERFPTLELIWWGHSIGGHVLGFMEDTSAIDRVITIGVGTGTWWLNAKPTRRVAWALWYGVVPLVVPFAGYYPGRKLKLMTDLPKGVIWQWRRWCLKKDYALAVEGDWLRQRFAEVTCPIDSVRFTDDDMMSETNMQVLHSWFVNAPVSVTHVSPADIGMKRIGHIGWHKRRYQPLWDKVFLPLLDKPRQAA